MLQLTYGADLRPVGMTNGTSQYASAATYTAQGKLSQVTFGNALRGTWSYNDTQTGNQRVFETKLLSGSTELSSLQTYWDAAGNLTRRTNWTMPDGSSVEDLLFRYDARHRLTAVLQPSSGNGWGDGPGAFYGTGSYAAYTASYEYDASGRMTTKSEPGSSASMTYSGANPVHAPKTVALNGAPAEAMTYDVNGNLLTGRGRTLSYDPQQRARSVTSGSVTTHYWYDADGRPALRDEVHSNGTVTKTLLVGSLYEEDVTPGGAKQGQAITYYVFGGQRIAQRTKRVAEALDQIVYLHADYLGSQAAVVGQYGNLISQVSYLPYGGIRAGTQTGAFGFTDQRLEGHGLHYYGNGSGYGRFYDSAIGVWTQPDPVTPGRDAAAWNRYGYVRWNPLKLVDPSGHVECTPANSYCDTPDYRIFKGLMEDVEQRLSEAGADRGELLDALHSMTPLLFAVASVAGGPAAALVVAVGDTAIHLMRGTYQAPTLDDIVASSSGMGSPLAIAGTTRASGSTVNRILGHRSTGLSFEAEVIEALAKEKNKGTRVYGTTEYPDRYGIPDVLSEGLTEIKSGDYIYDTRQLTIFYENAKSEGVHYNLIVKPGTRISVLHNSCGGQFTRPRSRGVNQKRRWCHTSVA